mmetsp:Transcript_39976/g.87117  ORF Transcript_39976/g.87117 Transcript_39976/m.87117 type:complete len:221 (+) Transcript_39976:27-689(+)
MEPSLAAVNSLCLTYEGRDKLARFFQFGSRAVMGFTAESSKASMRDVSTNARNLMVSLAAARRAFRFGRELPVILSIPKAWHLPDLLDRVMELSQKVTLLMFFGIDHIGWLQQIRLLRSGRLRGVGTVQLGLKWLTLSMLIATLCSARDWWRLRTTKSEGEEEKGKQQLQQQCKVGVVRNFFMAVQVAHLSRLLETHDAFVGTLGMITSVIDLETVWPKR